MPLCLSWSRQHILYLGLTIKLMKYSSYVVFFFSVLMFFGCKNDNANKGDKAPATETKKKELNANRVGTLYQYYHDNPTSQDQKDENALIDYAMDKELAVERTASGLYYLIHQKGRGPFYTNGGPCKAHYQGYTLDGKVFDSSYKRNTPLSFNVGQMIPGWNEALAFMNPGTKAQLLIPSRLAYGSRGFPGLIEPHTPLIFDVELLPLGSDM